MSSCSGHLSPSLTIGSPQLYFVKVDVQACFDTIDQAKLLEMLRDLLSQVGSASCICSIRADQHPPGCLRGPEVRASALFSEPDQEDVSETSSPRRYVSATLRLIKACKFMLSRSGSGLHCNSKRTCWQSP